MRLVRDLVESGEWRIINAMEERVQGGPFTRKDPASGKESLLDIWLCSASLAPHVKELYIDSSRKWMVARPVLKDGRMRLTHTDHYTMLATFQDLPVARAARQEEQVTRWKTGKKESWTQYLEASKDASKKIDKVVEETDKDINEVVKKIESIETKVKFEVFGKCSTKSSQKNNKNFTDPNNNLEDEEKSKQFLESQTKRLEDEISKIKETGQSKAGRIFQISKMVRGMDSNVAKATAIKDPSTGALIVDREAIKTTTVQYCKDVLKKNNPMKGFEKVLKVKEVLHNKRMKEQLGQGFIAEKEVFNQIIAKFRKKQQKELRFSC